MWEHGSGVESRCRITGAGGYLEYRGVGEGGRLLLYVGFGLGLRTGRNTRDREKFRTEQPRYLQGIHRD